MKKKCLILSAILLLAEATGYCQDTSQLSTGKHMKNNSDTLNSVVDPNTGIVNPDHTSGKPHTTLNPNSGTAIPNTTSGTLNSNVNPSTQFVIPIHKRKRKSNSNVTPDPGIITPK